MTTNDNTTAKPVTWTVKRAITTKKTTAPTDKDANINSNVTIDFEKKNNERTQSTPTKPTWTKSTSSRPATRKQSTWSSTGRSPSRTSTTGRAGTARGRTKTTATARHTMNSDNFTSHVYGDAVIEPLGDPYKLIKKGEKPVKIGSLMWLEQVGQCIFIEYEDDMIIVDAGMEFAADEEMGADYIVPDISYVKQNIKKLRGIVLSHGHLDHVGGLRDMLPDLGFPTIYTTPLTLWIVKKTFDNKNDLKKIKYKIVDPFTDILKLGAFTIEFVPVNHNIPETLAQAIYTPKWMIFNSSDFKFDYTPAIDKPTDLSKIARIGTEWVKLFIGDSLWCTNEWRAKSEKTIGDNLHNIIRTVNGRMIIATFASNVGRIIQLINSAIKMNRTVFLSGRSMLNNVEICQELGYIRVPKNMIRKLDESVNDFPPERVMILSTWAQWEEFAALTRMSRNEHAFVQLNNSDTILISSSTIPGNERQMAKMLNDLVVKNLNLITNNDMDIHASGHGGKEDHKLILALLKPEFFMPYYIDAKMRYAYKDIAVEMGHPEDKILMPETNGTVIEMYDDVVVTAKRKIRLQRVLVDWKGKWHLSGEYVIKARHIMAQGGMVSLIFKVDTKSKELVGNVQIESRWFVYSSEVKKIHTQIVEFVRKKYYDNRKRKMMVKDNLKQIKEDLWVYINKIIGRVPMIIPSFVYINREAVNPEEEIPEDEAIIGMTLEEQGHEE